MQTDVYACAMQSVVCARVDSSPWEKLRAYLNTEPGIDEKLDPARPGHRLGTDYSDSAARVVNFDRKV